MLRTNFNKGWEFSKGSRSMMSAFMGAGEKPVVVDLPHDAMVHEERTPDTANGTQTGYWPGGEYTYEKSFDVPEQWREKTAILEFEGVYNTAMVYVNGDLAATQLYGYSNFYVVLDKYLHYGQTNRIRVVADNSQERNSRWYSGSGIYRDVKLLLGNRVHVGTDGVRITTPVVGADSAAVAVETDLVSLTRNKEKIVVKTVLLAPDGTEAARDVVHVTLYGLEEETLRQRIDVKNPKLWDPEQPNLYECVVEVYSGDELLDTTKETFGIRTLELDAVHGLRINGKSVKLRGTCIHHDNGIIGATTLYMAEERRCRQMKEAGFNSIRSSHHPMSKAMLTACDRLGMLVMDELSDMWTNHKNANDFALHFTERWEKETERMVAKDYNHPSVILYSTGNEIPDMGTERGAQISRKICNRLHELDPYRYTTNAMNGMLALGEKMPLVMQDILKDLPDGLEMPPAGDGQPEEEGASGLNLMMAIMVGPLADRFACHPLMSAALEESSETMDIIGMNYLTGRHVLEKTLHPNKTVLGTETYPADIVRLWSIVKNNAHVLGDFTWTGYDYLGEAGCGTFYYDGTQNFAGRYPDRVAYIGDIDLIGYRRPISYLREIVFGLRKEPYIAVERVDKYGLKHSQTAWMWKDNIASWTWPGYEGKPANVDVYSDSEEVELFVNGVSMGRKAAGEANGFTATYTISYEPGTIEAVGYTDGEETGRHRLLTASEPVEIGLSCEEKTLEHNGEDLAFITVSLKDGQGNANLWAQKEITVSVEGAGSLQGFGSADPQAIGSYDDPTWKTYDGYLLAVVRAGREPGAIKVRFSAPGLPENEVVLQVR